ncbi:MAG: GTPase ObgE [Anaerolineales bacterium]|nr:GTPase ObgE [Anaerolineales bacterium]
MFIDEIAITVRSGKGGDGSVHFRREKYVPRGGPDGGDGGKGGDVILQVRETLNTLSGFHYNQRFIAEDGKPGSKQNQYGKSAEDLVIQVPPGTIVYDISDPNQPALVGDLVQPDQLITICKGGRGGRGNSHFATARNQTPHTAEKGEPGEEKRLKLELKLIADIGLIGVPNAGKSTLLAALTNARPKIAAYPFTTLEPNLGVARIDDDTTVVLADIPGLIERAHEGVGLGHDFLRHIQRTRVLIHLLDGLSVDPMADFSQINSELALFDKNLSKKPQIVALNKIDQPAVQELWPEFKKQMDKLGHEIMPISALARTDVRKLLRKAVEALSKAPAIETFEPAIPVYRPEEDPKDFRISREDDGSWRVSGSAIERSAAMTYWEHRGSLRRFQRLMERLGVEEALRAAGIEEGETVHIGEYALEWQD